MSCFFHCKFITLVPSQDTFLDISTMHGKFDLKMVPPWVLSLQHWLNWRRCHEVKTRCRNIGEYMNSCGKEIIYLNNLVSMCFFDETHCTLTFNFLQQDIAGMIYSIPSNKTLTHTEQPLKKLPSTFKTLIQPTPPIPCWSLDLHAVPLVALRYLAIDIWCRKSGWWPLFYAGFWGGGAAKFDGRWGILSCTSAQERFGDRKNMLNIG